MPLSVVNSSIVERLSLELDLILSEARAADKVLLEWLRESCLDLLEREEKLAKTDNGSLLDTAGDWIEFAITRKKEVFLDSRRELEAKRERNLREINSEKERLLSSDQEELKRSLDAYLEKRLDPLNALNHVPFRVPTRDS